MTKPKSKSTALAQVDDSPAALASVFGGDYSEAAGDDGLGETESGDVRIPIRKLNARGDADRGIPAPQRHLWYDSVTGEAVEEIRAVFVARARSNAYRMPWDNDAGRSPLVCASNDRVTGELFDTNTGDKTGDTRPCHKCPDAEWDRSEGKPHKNCAESWTFLAIDPDTEEPFLVRFSKTSMPAIKQHLQKYHLGKLRSVNKSAKAGANLPVFAYVVTLRGEMDKGGNFARPVIDIVGPAPAELVNGIMAQHEVLAGLLERKRDDAEKDDHDAEAPAAPGAGDFVDEAGSGFVE